MRLEEATDVFCRSFAFTRSFTFPFEFVRIGDLRVLRDVKPKRYPRATEIVLCGISPEQALRQIPGCAPPHHFLCVICAVGETEMFLSWKAAYKAAGYRLQGTEAFFARDLTKPISSSPLACRLVTTHEEADLIAKAARSRQIPLDKIGSREIRLYAAWEDERPVGWVRSIHVQPESTYASNLYVRNEHRRRGFGTALMTALVEGDIAAGAKHGVLLASTAGSYLYPQLGYERIGSLALFSKWR